MGGNSRKLSGKIFSDKKVLVFSFGLVLFLAFLPFSYAQAEFWDGLVNALLRGVSSILDTVVGTIAGMVKFFAGAIASVMVAAINFFMGFPVSPGNDLTPTVIKDGWEASRDLVNIFFILILAFIGLATILRLQSYQMQKTLPSLIIIALLVNFSGVFVGFVVDMGNVFTSAFLDAGPNLVEWRLGDIPAIGGASALGQHLVGIIYYFISFLVYFVVILIFAIRAFALWTIVIFAPLAFGAYILPATKKWWTQWLQQLIQWSIVGIPISFTLYLAKTVMETARDRGPGSFGSIFEGSAIADLAAPFTALFLLFTGISISIQMAPSGAQGAINWGRKAGSRTMAWAGRETWRKGGKSIEKFGANVRKRGQGLDVKADEQTRLEKIAGATIGKVPGIGILGKNRISRFGGRIIGGGIEIGSAEANANVRERDRNAVSDGEKLTGVDSDKGLAFLKEQQMMPPLPRDTSKMLGAFTQIIKNGDTKDLKKAINNGDFNYDFVAKLHKNATENGNIDQERLIEKAFLSQALDEKDDQGNVTKRNMFGLSQEDQEKTLRKIKATDFGDGTNGAVDWDNINPNTKSGAKTLESIIETSPQLVPQILPNLGKDRADAIWGHIQGKGAQWLLDHGGEKILRWSANNAAAGLGYGAVDNLSKTQIDAMISAKGSSLSDEQLKERKGRLEEDLAKMPKGNNKLRQQIDQIKDELNSRLESTDSIEVRKVDWENQMKEINAKKDKTEKDYRDRAVAEKTLSAIKAELRRRGKSEAAPTAEEEPLSIQIEKLLEEERNLEKERPHLFGLARDKINKDLGDKSANRRKLEERLRAIPADSPLKKAEEEIRDIFKQIRGQELSREVVQKEMEGVRAQKGKVSPEKELELAARERGAQSMINRANAEIDRLTKEKDKLIPDWKTFSTLEGGRRPEIGMIKDVIKLRQEADKTKSKLKTLKVSKAALGEIKSVEKYLRDIQRELDSEEENLAMNLREKRLRADLQMPHTAPEETVINEELGRITKIRETLVSSAGKTEAELSDETKKSLNDSQKILKDYRKRKEIKKEMENLAKKAKKQL